MAMCMAQAALITKALSLSILRKGSAKSAPFFYAVAAKTINTSINIELATLWSPIRAFTLLRKSHSSTKISPMIHFIPLKAQTDEPAGIHKDNPKYGKSDGGKVERHF